MKKRFADISTIQTGVFARPAAKGDTLYLQARHFDESGRFQPTPYRDLRMEEGLHKHLLRPGDIVFAAKGMRNFAAVYDEGDPPAVASTTFLVIRIMAEEILPHYIAWYLNLPETQKELQEMALGSAMPSIPKSVLAEMPVPVPSITSQKNILQIARLNEKRKHISERLETLYDHTIQYQLINAIRQ